MLLRSGVSVGRTCVSGTQRRDNLQILKGEVYGKQNGGLNTCRFPLRKKQQSKKRTKMLLLAYR